MGTTAAKGPTAADVAAQIAACEKEIGLLQQQCADAESVAVEALGDDAKYAIASQKTERAATALNEARTRRARLQVLLGRAELGEMDEGIAELEGRLPDLRNTMRAAERAWNEFNERDEATKLRGALEAAVNRVSGTEFELRVARRLRSLKAREISEPAAA